MRRNLDRLDAGGKWHERPLGNEHVVGEAAVDRQPREVVSRAEHVDPATTGNAEPATPGREDEHGVALRDRRHTCADLLHPARVLVAQNERQRHSGGLHEPFDRMEVGGTDTGAADPHEDVVRSVDLGNRSLDDLERLVVLAHQCGSHVSPWLNPSTTSRRFSR